MNSGHIEIAVKKIEINHDQRDDNAAINLARYEDTDTESGSAVGPVGAAVKRGADRKTGPRPAGGCETRKGRSHTAAEQPRDGVRVA